MRLAAALAFLATWALPAAAAPGEETPTKRAENELAAICRELTQGDNVYFGSARSDELARQLERPDLPPPQRAAGLLELSNHLLRLGRVEEAGRRIREAEALAAQYGMLERPEVRSTLSFGLALTELLTAEDRNCVDGHHAASCILPLAPEAVHRDPGPVRRAGDHLLDYLRLNPRDVQARWLLNLTRMLSGDYPRGVPELLRLPPDALRSEEPMARWVDVASRLGVGAFDLAGGAVMDDFDGDGLLDLVSSTSDPCGPLKAYRNDGEGGFEAVAEGWGLAGQLGGLNLIHGDYDGDGRLDLLVLRGGWMGEEGRIRNSLLRNQLDGDGGGFVDVTVEAGLAAPAYPTQTAAWADFDGDGDLDLYVGNEGTGYGADPEKIDLRSGLAYPAQLFENLGDGTFADVAAAAGVTNDRFAKGVAWGDYDDDGDADLWVSNIGPNRLYRNDGGGRFTDVAPELGVVEPVGSSFASWFFDYDNDGDLDLWVNRYGVAPWQVSAAYLGQTLPGGQPLLYRNDGGRFTDASAEVGLARPHLVMGANHGDLDGDGWLDVYLGTGTPAFEALMPNVMYRNDAGRRFRDVTFSGGFGHLQKGHGVAFGDLDNDGDEDLFHQLGGFYPVDGYANALFENPGEHRFLLLELIGRRANRFGVGARVEVVVREGDERRAIRRRVGSGGSFGGNSLRQEIGLGSAESVESIEIVWPGSGARQRFEAVAIDRAYRAVEGAAELEPLDLPSVRWGAKAAPSP